MRVICMMVALLAVGMVPALAAPSYVGPSGNIMTPDELTVPQGEFSIGYHRFVDLGVVGGDTDVDFWSGNYGLTPNIEVGLSVVDEKDGGDTDIALNGKWRIVNETATSPAIAVGVLDATGMS